MCPGCPGSFPGKSRLGSCGGRRLFRTRPPTRSPILMTFYLGILLALGCALVTQLGFLYKHRGACEAPQVDVTHPLRTGKALFANKWFALGWGVAVAAWFLHVGAMALAPLSVVQAVLSTGVVMLAV